MMPIVPPTNFSIPVARISKAFPVLPICIAASSNESPGPWGFRRGSLVSEYGLVDFKIQGPVRSRSDKSNTI
jgi:hypothetical protein